MTIDADEFKANIAEAYIKLLDSERGVAAALAKSIGKPGGFITEVKRGKPVNALHLKAVSIVFGQKKVLEILSKDDEYDLDKNSEQLLRSLDNVVRGALADELYLIAYKIEESLTSAGAIPGKDYTILDLYKLAQPFAVEMMKSGKIKETPWG